MPRRYRMGTDYVVDERHVGVTPSEVSDDGGFLIPEEFHEFVRRITDGEFNCLQINNNDEETVRIWTSFDDEQRRSYITRLEERESRSIIIPVLQNLRDVVNYYDNNGHLNSIPVRFNHIEIYLNSANLIECRERGREVPARRMDVITGEELDGTGTNNRRGTVIVTSTPTVTYTGGSDWAVSDCSFSSNMNTGYWYSSPEFFVEKETKIYKENEPSEITEELSYAVVMKLYNMGFKCPNTKDWVEKSLFQLYFDVVYDNPKALPVFADEVKFCKLTYEVRFKLMFKCPHCGGIHNFENGDITKYQGMEWDKIKKELEASALSYLINKYEHYIPELLFESRKKNV